MQFTGQNWFTRSIKWWMAVMYAKYSLGMEGEATKESTLRGTEQWVNGNSQSSASRMAMTNDSTAVPWYVCCFHSPFHISSALLIGYLQSDPCSHYLSMFALTCPLVEYFTSHTPNLEQCASYRGSRQIWSRRQYVPNKLYALNNDVCLINRFYGM